MGAELLEEAIGRNSRENERRNAGPPGSPILTFLPSFPFLSFLSFDCQAEKRVGQVGPTCGLTQLDDIAISISKAFYFTYQPIN